MQALLVDDHPLIHQIIPALLRRAIGDHVMVQSAETLEEALDCVRRNAPVELVLLDLGLPGCTGIEALERLRERCPKAKIVVLSATEDCESIQAAFRAGVEGYIPKTSPPPTIVDALRLVCDGGTYVPPQALDLTESGAAQPNFSRRQREVLHLMLRGLSNREIAKRMR